MARGGRRAGSGRPADAGDRRIERCDVPLATSELAELQDAAGDTPLAQYLRDAGLARARGR